MVQELQVKVLQVEQELRLTPKGAVAVVAQAPSETQAQSIVLVDLELYCFHLGLLQLQLESAEAMLVEDLQLETVAT